MKGGGGYGVTRSKIPKKPITFEIVQASELSNADLDFIVKLFARAIHRQLESAESLPPQEDQRCESETEPDQS